MALEAIRGDKTIQEMGQANGVPPNLIAQWKKHLVDAAPELFDRVAKESEMEKAAERERERILQQLGSRWRTNI